MSSSCPSRTAEAPRTRSNIEGLLRSVRIVSAGPLLLLAACSGSPTSPVPPPAPDLNIACPSSITLNSTNGLAIPVTYGTATSTGGTPPVQIVCTPPSGSVFNPGATTVSCAATDSRNATKACTFGVTVTVPPRLSATEFVAFGDSITAGEVVSENAVGFRSLRVDPTLAYPTDLNNMLSARYTAQAISVVNKGASGESTADGRTRLPLAIASVGVPVQALLLMEGSNDITSDPSTIAPAANNIDQMIAYAKARSIRVYLASIPPQSTSITNGCPTRDGGIAEVAAYNTALRKVAANEGVNFVDVYAALNSNLALYIDCDGLHPTPQGYTRIAQEFFNAIQSTLETTSAAPPVLTAGVTAPPAIVPKARGTSRSRN